MQKDDLEVRMKRYEFVTKSFLMRRTPVIIRLDGRAFHTFTYGFQKPFDHVFMESMNATMQHLCEVIPGCVLGYKQSDEITLVLVDYAKLDTEPWFNNCLQKICSVAASEATLVFNREFGIRSLDWYNHCKDHLLTDSRILDSKENMMYKTPEGACICAVDLEKRYNIYKTAWKRGATFDARVFNVPKEEVLNHLVWRQQDARRNSIQMVGQTYFDSDTLYNMTIDEIIQALDKQHNVDWYEFSQECKLGTCCRRKNVIVQPTSNSPRAVPTERIKWVVDKEIPLFHENSDYIDSLIFVGE